VGWEISVIEIKEKKVYGISQNKHVIIRHELNLTTTTMMTMNEEDVNK